MSSKRRKGCFILTCISILLLVACTNEFGYEEDKIYNQNDLGEDNFIRERFDGFTDIQDVLEEGKRVIKKIYNVDLFNEAIRQEISLESWNDSYYWNITWVTLDEQGNWKSEFRINVDAENGIIMQLYTSDIEFNEYYWNYENGTLDNSKMVTIDEAKQLALELINAIGIEATDEDSTIISDGLTLLGEDYILENNEQKYYFSIQYGKITWFNRYYSEEMWED